MPTDSKALREKFFEWVYEEREGWICLARADRDNPRRTFKQEFFRWPIQAEEMYNFIVQYSRTSNVWYCVNVLEKAERLKENTVQTNLVWADLDTCHPKQVEPYPSLVIQSSPNRYQALWKLDQDIPPDVAEDYSKRIAYKYKQEGVDPTGWDLTQLLRVPYTKNLKYDEAPEILILGQGNSKLIPVTDFESIERGPEAPQEEEADVPDIDELAEPPKIFYKYSVYLDNAALALFVTEPEEHHDWSDRMWKLINLCFEAGMTEEEVFSIAISAKCNKYKRDHRPVRFLWKEVLKASSIQKRISGLTEHWEPLLMPEIIDRSECTWTFIDEYHKWASESTDAVPEFHHLCGAIVLSSVLASSIKLDTSYGSIVPNLWGLILGDSTLSRKTTAMEMAKGILYEVDPDVLLATDGSSEGLLTGLSVRPNRVSMFHKDEVSGFFEQINRKDYLAGMPETLTQLYDVPRQYTRMLRKETITITNPVFIFFGGGIKDQVYSALSEHYVTSGFLPRFLVVVGNADVSKIKPTGPPALEGIMNRQKIINDLLDARERFLPIQGERTMRIGSQVIELSEALDPPRTKGILTNDAWEEYQRIEQLMVNTAYESYYAALALPTFERLSRSLLKLAVLLAGMEREPVDGQLEVSKQDIINAGGFIQSWGRYSVDVLINAGISTNMRAIEKTLGAIRRRPGILKSEIMRAYHYNANEIKLILETLGERGEIKKVKQGRTERLWPI